MVTQVFNFGIWGELMVARYLELAGYQLISWRFKGQLGELDWVVWAPAASGAYPSEVVFVEVKAIRVGQASVLESISLKKVGRLWITAQKYLKINNLKPAAVRLDVIGLEFDFVRKSCIIRHFINF